jgi:hypothetical protein
MFGARARVIGLSLSLSLFACAPPPKAPEVAAAPTTEYRAMAPIAQYRVASADEEVRLARSAAPPSVSGQADVFVLGEHGYAPAVKGSNGFACIVERAWAKDFDDAGFWNPKIRAPICFNQAAVRSVLPTYLERTEWVLAGTPIAEMIERTKAEVAAKKIVPPEVGAMCFMMSKEGYLNDGDGSWHPHLMFFVPGAAAAEWGANLPGSPLFAFESKFEPLTIFMSPVRKWSDGTHEESKM